MFLPESLGKCIFFVAQASHGDGSSGPEQLLPLGHLEEQAPWIDLARLRVWVHPAHNHTQAP